MAPREGHEPEERIHEPPREQDDPRRGAAPEVGVDPREEDGWDQPQSSAQTGPTSQREPED